MNLRVITFSPYNWLIFLSVQKNSHAKLKIAYFYMWQMSHSSLTQFSMNFCGKIKYTCDNRITHTLYKQVSCPGNYFVLE